MLQTISQGIKSKGAGEAILYAGVLGLLVSDIVPTPADAVYFRFMEKNKQKLEKNIITPKQYWTRDALLYYSLNPIWWALVLAVVVNTKGGLDNKVKVGLGIVGAGVVLGVLSKNIKEEEKLKNTTNKLK